jgi:hypothetical protein
MRSGWQLMNHPIVQISRKRSDQLSGGVMPVSLPVAEDDRAFLVRNTGTHLDISSHTVHRDGNHQISHPVAKTHGAFQPRH